MADFWEAVKIGWEAVKTGWEQLKYIKHLEHNVGTLQSKTGVLEARQKDIKEELRKEEVQAGKKRKREIEEWLKTVKKIKKEVNTISERCRDERGLWSRYKLGKLVAEQITQVEELHEKGKFPDSMVTSPLVGGGSIMPVPPLVGQRNHELEKQIWDCLHDTKIAKIGIYGMAGVGKTTITKHINNRLKGAGSFDSIIWVTVSKDLSLKRLQSDIAQAIQLRFSKHENKFRRSARLFEALVRRNKFVLILDDVWQAFPFEEVGIPEPNQDNGCKVIITTRMLQVCRELETQTEIKIDVLPHKEAWALFKSKLDIDGLPLEIEDYAERVAKECGSLPLAIVVVGRALRKEMDVREWRKALWELKSSKSKIKGMQDDVFWRLKFSYNRLPNDQVRACFLYCSLYPEDYHIRTTDLINNWISEGLTDNSGTREDDMDEGTHILNQLIRACMLVRGYTEEYVQMHDLIRDMAIDATRESPHFIVNAGFKLEVLPKEEEWVDVERASLMRNNFELLLDTPDCPRLSTLFLGENPQLVQSFFERMKGLRVLDLSSTAIQLLPISISYLENLHVLLLRYCKQLKTVSLVAKLRKLQVLDLSNSSIEEMPHEMEGLANLEVFNLSWTKIKLLPKGVSEMKNLRELILAFCKGLQLVPSLAKLKELRVLNLNSSLINELPSGMEGLVNLEVFYLSWSEIKLLSEGVSEMKNLRELRLESCKGLQLVPSLAKLKELRILNLNSSSIKELPSGIEGLVNLEVFDLSFTKIKFLPEGLTEMKNLRRLILTYCERLELVPSLAKLKELRVLNLYSTSIKELPSGMEGLVNLMELNLCGVEGLRSSFPGEKIAHLVHLKELDPVYPSFIDDRILGPWVLENVLGEIARLSKLTNLSLSFTDLPTFFKYVRHGNWQVLEYFFFKVGDGGAAFGFHPYWFYGRKTVAFVGCDVTSGEAPLLLPSTTLSLVFLECHNITHFSLSQFKCLVDVSCLAAIYMRNCRGIEHISREGQNLSFTTLKRIELHELPNLRTIFDGVLLPGTLAALEQLEIRECHELKRLFSVRTFQDLQNLRSIEVSTCSMIEEIVSGEEEEIGEATDNDFNAINLPNLVSLGLFYLPKLKSIFTTRELVFEPSTRGRISIERCPQLKKLLSVSKENSSQSIRGRIKGSRKWWDELEWDDPNNKALLQPLFKDEDEVQTEEKHEK